MVSQTGAGGEEVVRLASASASARQDGAATVPVAAVPRGGSGAEFEHWHGGPDLAALAWRGHGCSERQTALRKLDEEDAQRLAQWARDQPLSAPELLQRHTDARGKPVHVDTLVRYLKEGGLVWKRTRHSLKKKI